MLIEDDTVARTLLGTILEEAGCTVVTAANGRDALDLLRAGERPSVILLDLKMPVMSGWEFREQQRRDARLADIPIVVLSADGDLDEVCAALGAAACFSKPIDPEGLLVAIRKLSV
jgi:CheY-like chemotaxis protein